MAWATLDELVYRLGLTVPTSDQLEEAQRSLDAAAGEISSYLDVAADDPPRTFTTDQLALLNLVNLDRAQEHYKHPVFGALQQGADIAPVLTAQDSFTRHRRKLVSLKTGWGLA